MSSFSELSLLPKIHAALVAQGYERPTPIQASAIPPALQGRDILGIAQTGTGKTAAFALPILQRLSSATGRSNGIRALILTPTRELAIQIDDSIAGYGAGLGLRHAVIFGGVGRAPQVSALRRGIDILVATPGRLLDLMDEGHVRLDRLEVFVLDEADRMLDMGFIHDVRKVIAKLPKERQTLFFSATMPQEITDLAARLLKDPVRVEVAPVASTAERVEQRVIFVPAAEKRRLLIDLLNADADMDRVMVFTRTKHGADKVATQLAKAGVATAAIHGNKSQGARQAALEGFRAGSVRVLVATDIAARGIDVDGVSHVVNFELPNIPESYVHRIGRTARAGASGIAIAFCDDGEERSYLRDIEKLTRMPLTVVGAPPALHAPSPEPSTARPAPKRAPAPKRNEPRRRRGDHSRADQAQRKTASQGRDAARNAPPPHGKVTAFSDLVSAINGPTAGGNAERRRRP
jgi:ATP-dependent RNA helicase RhlE